MERNQQQERSIGEVSHKEDCFSAWTAKVLGGNRPWNPNFLRNRYLADAYHLMLLNTYNSTMANLYFRHKLIEMAVLKELAVVSMGEGALPYALIREWWENIVR
jgi:hypothetical protein